MPKKKTNQMKGRDQTPPEVIELTPQVHMGKSSKHTLPANCFVVPMVILRKPERIVRRKPKHRQ